MKNIGELGKNVYLVGIKGAGMAGLAQILKGIGYRVEGSDITDSFFTDDILKREGIKFFEGFNSENIPQNIDWTVSSEAYLQGQNIEIEELKKRNIPIFSYPEALGYFFNQCFGIAVTGTHGKSTTSAMIAHILTQAGKNPFALIGAELLNWNSNARVPATSYKLQATSHFVIEADEYREQFLHYKPQMLVITNIDYDHPDCFPTKASYKNAFEKLKKQVKENGVIIELSIKNKVLRIPLQVIGVHNQQNAALAYEVCRKLGIDDETIKNALKNFKGTRRRLESIGKFNGALIIDDYAHHPAEITASLFALKNSAFYDGRRKMEYGKLIVLFHPHTYSRTQQFLKEFAKALTLADEIYVLDIYSSAREQGGSVNSDDIVEKIQGLGHDAINLHSIQNAVHYFQDYLKKGDTLVTMGAGDVFRVAKTLTNYKNPAFGENLSSRFAQS